jgi:CoA:oxalate CoA-transferase
MTALWHREKTGKGQQVDVSMLETMVAILEGGIVRWTIGKELLSPIGSMNPHEAPMAAFKCKDGYIIIAAVGDEHWQRFCRAINRPDWAADPALQTKAQRWAKKYMIQEEIEKITTKHTLKEVGEMMDRERVANSPILNIKEVGEMMDRERVANSPILNIKEVVEDPHLKERGYFVDIEHPVIGKAKIPGIPFKMSESPGAVERPSPLVGEHNELILGKYLGIGKGEIDKLKGEGAV